MDRHDEVHCIRYQIVDLELIREFHLRTCTNSSDTRPIVVIDTGQAVCSVRPLCFAGEAGLLFARATGLVDGPDDWRTDALRLVHFSNPPMNYSEGLPCAPYAPSSSTIVIRTHFQILKMRNV